MADEKAPHRANSAVSDHGTDRVGSVAEVNDLTQLGYKPEMVRNRSMLTLLFQSLAIAAIRMSNVLHLVSSQHSTAQHTDRSRSLRRR